MAEKLAAPLAKFLNDDRADWTTAWKLFPGNVANVWHASMSGDVVAESLKTCGFELRSQIIWAKSHFALSRGDYHWQHETCYYAVRKRRATALARWSQPKHALGSPQQYCLQKSQPEKSWGHSTQKPVEIMRRPIENNSVRGDGVYDPFLGSGTSIIAAEMAGRFCVGVELNPAYVDVSVRRWMEFTGQDANAAACRKRSATNMSSHSARSIMANYIKAHLNKIGGRDRRLTLFLSPWSCGKTGAHDLSDVRDCLLVGFGSAQAMDKLPQEVPNSRQSACG